MKGSSNLRERCRTSGYNCIRVVRWFSKPSKTGLDVAGHRHNLVTTASNNNVTMLVSVATVVYYLRVYDATKLARSDHPFTISSRPPLQVEESTRQILRDRRFGRNTHNLQLDKVLHAFRDRLLCRIGHIWPFIIKG